MTLFLIEVMIVNEDYKPVLFDISKIADYEQFNELIQNNSLWNVHDNLTSQIEELVKCRRPDLHALGDLEGLKAEVVEFMKNIEYDRYGTWVYYPWSGRAVHILPEKEFIEVRTNRNKMKITLEEQELLSGKRVGVIGLSVGQSVAITMAIERVAGEIRIADFDHLDLSNLNRIRGSIHNLGLNKSILVARDIAEIDPFIKVKVFTDGINDENIDPFLTEGGNIDLLHEECDDVFMKLLVREKAKEIGIPVIMEASDKCTIDIERFDLDQNRPMLHGLLGDLSSNDVKKIDSKSEAISLMLEMVQVDNLSARVKASITEIGTTTGTWPQLASAVMMGGAITANLTRQVLLGNFSHSGRYQVDIDDIFDIPNPGSPVAMGIQKKEEHAAIIDKYLRSHPLQVSDLIIQEGDIKAWIEQVFILEENFGHIFLFSRNGSPDPLAKAQATIIAGFIAQLIRDEETIIQSFPVPGHTDLIAVIRSMGDEFIRTEGSPDFRQNMQDLKRRSAEKEATGPVSSIRKSLLSEFGIAQLCDNLNPYLTNNPADELSLRLIRQSGVAKLLNSWGMGSGVDNILTVKLADCASHSIEINNESSVLIEFGRAIGHEHLENKYDNNIAFLYLKNNESNWEEGSKLTIEFGIRPISKDESTTDKYLRADNIKDIDSNQKPVSDL